MDKITSNDKIEFLFEYLGENEDERSFKTRKLIIDTIAGIETQKYLSDICNYAGQLAAQEHLIDNDYVPNPEFQIGPEDLTEEERQHLIEWQKEHLEEWEWIIKDP